MSSEFAQGTVMSAKAAPPVGPYPHARRAGDFLFLSGIGPRLPQSGKGVNEIPGVTLSPEGAVLDYDVALQTHSCFRNVKAVLEEAGLTLADVVDVQAFLVDIKRNFRSFNETYREYFNQETGPTRTTIGVEGLPTPIHVELKVIAVFPNTMSGL